MSELAIGLALSGGTAKSVAHVGVIKALVEAGIEITHVAGCSGGSIVGAMYCSGMPISTMESVATKMSWRKLISIKLTRLGFISSERIEEFVREMIGDVSFDELKTPLSVVTTNLVTGAKRVFDVGPVARAVRASCSIPQIYLPVEIGGEYLVDGGLSEYLPVETLDAMGAPFLVGSHLGPHNDAYHRPHHILHLVIQLTGLMARKNYPVSRDMADFVIHPNVDPFSSFDFESSKQIIEVGYEATRRAVPELIEAIQSRSPEPAWRRLLRWPARSRKTLG